MKLTNWAKSLDDYVAQAHARSFSYDAAEGLDCCTFTFGAIHAQTGRLIGTQFRGCYRNRREALLLMRNYAGKPFLALAITKLMREEGFATVQPMYAQRGDAVLVPLKPFGARDHFFGILDLNGRDVLGVGDLGLRRLPISIRCRAWRIE